MRSSLFNRLLIYLLVWSQSTVSIAANLAPEFQSRSLGIVRVGEYSNEAAEAYPFLEKRLKRWFENSFSHQAIVEPLEKSYSKEELLIEQSRLQLAASVEKLLSNLFSSAKPSADLVAAVQRDRQKVNLVARFGPLLQKSHLAEAAYFWKTGETEKAKQSVVSAHRLHPEGVVQNLTDWDAQNTGHFPMDVFEAFVSRYLSSKIRSCQLQVTTEPAAAKIKVNGFEFGSRRHFSFVTGGVYYLQGSLRGLQTEEALIRCERQGIQRLRLSLKEGVSDSSLELADAHKQSSARSFLLVELNKDKFRIYLYTPQLSLDELPLYKSLTVAEIRNYPSESGLPTASDAAKVLFDKHHLQQSLSLALNPQPHPLLPRNMSTESVDSPKWYNNWVLWTIAGGIATGAAIAYFASRKDSNVGSQTPRVKGR